MSDPNYNRKQNAQKYWAMFQRNYRKQREAAVKAQACEVPHFVRDEPLYPQLEHYSRTETMPAAVAVYSEMFAFLESVYAMFGDAYENFAPRRQGSLTAAETQQFYADIKHSNFHSMFKLKHLPYLLSLADSSKLLTYMQRVRLRKLFPEKLTKNDFVQWNVEDKYPKTTGDLVTSDDVVMQSVRNFEVFKESYDMIRGYIDEVERIFEQVMDEVQHAESLQTALFRNYISVKKKLADVNRKIQEAVDEHVRTGVDRFKSMEGWAAEFGFDVGESYELLYKTVSVDHEDEAGLCKPGEDCLRSKEPILELATEIDPQSVPLSSLHEFVNKTLRPFAEGSAARQLARAESILNVRKDTLTNMVAQVNNCKSIFDQFINLWDTLYSDPDLINDDDFYDFAYKPLATGNKLKYGALKFVKEDIVEDDIEKTAEIIEVYDALDESLTEDLSEHIKEGRQRDTSVPLRKLFADARAAQKAALAELEEEREQERRTQAYYERERLAQSIADRLAESVKRAGRGRREFERRPMQIPPNMHRRYVETRSDSDDGSSSSDDDDDDDDEGYATNATVPLIVPPTDVDDSEFESAADEEEGNPNMAGFVQNAMSRRKLLLPTSDRGYASLGVVPRSTGSTLKISKTLNTSSSSSSSSSSSMPPPPLLSTKPPTGRIPASTSIKSEHEPPIQEEHGGDGDDDQDYLSDHGF